MKMPNTIGLCTILTFFYSNVFGQDTIQLKNYFRELKTVNIAISGKKYNFLFDTGGGETFISTEIANDLKKEIYSKHFGMRMNGEKVYYKKCDSIVIDLGAAKLFHATLGVWDVMNVLPKELPKIDGVISLKSFQNKVISIDLTNNWLIIETSASYNKKTNNMMLLNSRFANGPDGNELTVFLSTLHKQHLYWFLFDSGNISECILSPQTAYEWGLQSDTTSVSKEYSDAVVALGVRKHKVKVVTQNIIFEGVLDYNFISKGVYIIDLIENKVWTN